MVMSCGCATCDRKELTDKHSHYETALPMFKYMDVSLMGTRCVGIRWLPLAVLRIYFTFTPLELLICTPLYSKLCCVLPGVVLHYSNLQN